MKIEPVRQQRIYQQIMQFHPEIANQSYVEHKRKEELKRKREKQRKKAEELEKIKKHHTVNKTIKSKLDGTINKVRPDKQGKIDHTI